MRNVESRDKCFVLDLKLLFIIVDCFSERFLPRFFTVINTPNISLVIGKVNFNNHIYIYIYIHIYKVLFFSQ